MADRLARRVRGAGESEDVDLGGFTPAQIQAFVPQAFEEPIPATGALRFTFVVGGGKGSRQKYDDAAGKELCSALRGLGFEDDPSASESTACQGVFKTKSLASSGILPEGLETPRRIRWLPSSRRTAQTPCPRSSDPQRYPSFPWNS